MKNYLEACSQNLLCAFLSTYLFVAIIAASIFVATKFVHQTHPNLTSFYCDLKDNEMPNTQTRTMKLTDIEGQPLCIRVAQIDYIRMPKSFDQTSKSKTGCVIHISGMALPVQEKFEDVEKQVRWARGDD